MRVNTPQINHQTIEGEVVVINLENGFYYSLLDLSAALWHLAASGLDLDAIVERVAATYPDVTDAAGATRAFLDELVAEQLLVDGEGSPAPAEAGLPTRYTAPLLEKFTDMQELLMLDPIHEVDSIGWPHKPTGT